MPVTPSLTKQGILLLVEYRKKLDNLIKNYPAHEKVSPQYLAARDVLHVIIDAANSIVWPFIQNLLANKKKLTNNFMILSQGKKVAISIMDSASLLLSKLTIDLLLEIKNNLEKYLDIGTGLNKIGPLLAPFLGEEIKIENTEQAFAVVQFHLLTTIAEITNEMQYYNDTNHKNIIHKPIIFTQQLTPIPIKSPQTNSVTDSLKEIHDEERIHASVIDQACLLLTQKKNKTTQISLLLSLIDQIKQPDFFQNWPLNIPEEILQIAFSRQQKLYMAVTTEQKYRLIQNIIINIFLCVNSACKKQIKEKINTLPIAIRNNIFIKKHLDILSPNQRLSNLTFEIRERYILLLKNNPGIFPVSFAMVGLRKALKNCRSHHQVQDIIISAILLQQSLKNFFIDSQLILKALVYEMTLSLKEKSPISRNKILQVPGSHRFHTIACLNKLLAVCQKSEETMRVYYLANLALNKINGHLKNKILDIIKVNNLENSTFSSFDNIINEQIILLLQYILNREQKNLFFLCSYTKEPYYMMDFPKRLIKKLFKCQYQSLDSVKEEIDNMQAVLRANEHYYAELKSLLKKIYHRLYQLAQNESTEKIQSENNIKAVFLKKC